MIFLVFLFGVFGQDAPCKDDAFGFVAANGANCDALIKNGCATDMNQVDSNIPQGFVKVWDVCPVSCNSCSRSKPKRLCISDDQTGFLARAGVTCEQGLRFGCDADASQVDSRLVKNYITVRDFCCKSCAAVNAASDAKTATTEGADAVTNAESSKCPGWVKSGYCRSNDYVKKNCAKACAAVSSSTSGSSSATAITGSSLDTDGIQPQAATSKASATEIAQIKELLALYFPSTIDNLQQGLKLDGTLGPRSSGNPYQKASLEGLLQFSKDFIEKTTSVQKLLSLVTRDLMGGNDDGAVKMYNDAAKVLKGVKDMFAEEGDAGKLIQVTANIDLYSIVTRNLDVYGLARLFQNRVDEIVSQNGASPLESLTKLVSPFKKGVEKIGKAFVDTFKKVSFGSHGANPPNPGIYIKLGGTKNPLLGCTTDKFSASISLFFSLGFIYDLKSNRHSVTGGFGFQFDTSATTANPLLKLDCSKPTLADVSSTCQSNDAAACQKPDVRASCPLTCCSALFKAAGLNLGAGASNLKCKANNVLNLAMPKLEVQYHADTSKITGDSWNVKFDVGAGSAQIPLHSHCQGSNKLEIAGVGIGITLKPWALSAQFTPYGSPRWWQYGSVHVHELNNQLVITWNVRGARSILSAGGSGTMAILQQKHCNNPEDGQIIGSKVSWLGPAGFAQTVGSIGRVDGKAFVLFKKNGEPWACGVLGNPSDLLESCQKMTTSDCQKMANKAACPYKCVSTRRRVENKKSDSNIWKFKMSVDYGWTVKLDDFNLCQHRVIFPFQLLQTCPDPAKCEDFAFSCSCTPRNRRRQLLGQARQLAVADTVKQYGEKALNLIFMYLRDGRFTKQFCLGASAACNAGDSSKSVSGEVVVSGSVTGKTGKLVVTSSKVYASTAVYLTLSQISQSAADFALRTFPFLKMLSLNTVTMTLEGSLNPLKVKGDMSGRLKLDGTVAQCTDAFQCAMSKLKAGTDFAIKSELTKTTGVAELAFFGAPSIALGDKIKIETITWLLGLSLGKVPPVKASTSAQVDVTLCVDNCASSLPKLLYFSGKMGAEMYMLSGELSMKGSWHNVMGISTIQFSDLSVGAKFLLSSPPVPKEVKGGGNFCFGTRENCKGSSTRKIKGYAYAKLDVQGKENYFLGRVTAVTFDTLLAVLADTLSSTFDSIRTSLPKSMRESGFLPVSLNCESQDTNPDCFSSLAYSPLGDQKLTFSHRMPVVIKQGWSLDTRLRFLGWDAVLRTQWDKTKFSGSGKMDPIDILGVFLIHNGQDQSGGPSLFMNYTLKPFTGTTTITGFANIPKLSLEAQVTCTMGPTEFSFEGDFRLLKTFKAQMTVQWNYIRRSVAVKAVIDLSLLNSIVQSVVKRILDEVGQAEKWENAVEGLVNQANDAKNRVCDTIGGQFVSACKKLGAQALSGLTFFYSQVINAAPGVKRFIKSLISRALNGLAKTATNLFQFQSLLLDAKMDKGFKSSKFAGAVKFIAAGRTFIFDGDIDMDALSSFMWQQVRNSLPNLADLVNLAKGEYSKLQQQLINAKVEAGNKLASLVSNPIGAILG